MNKSLVIVESPAKARTISRFLGPDVIVQASMGHVRDLPQYKFGVDIENDFAPQYELTPNGKKVMRSLKSAASEASNIYLATDPDREGEAIAWHLEEVLKKTARVPFHRITFHEITQSAITRSFETPGSIALDMVAAQQARRVLDRIVGYKVSPLLWKKVKKGTSAGRVQSVALRLVVEREREIDAFKPEEYWNLDGIFELDGKTKLKMRLAKLNGEKAAIHTNDEANALADALRSSDVHHKIIAVNAKPRTQSAPPPFITSTLQQACGSALKIGARQTMQIAQELYEGVELGAGGSVGLITYMRTDSVNIAKEAQDQARAFIATTFGQDYVPPRPNVFHSRKTAQEAHEAIRPTDVRRTPESLAPYLTPHQLKVYRIIWNRFLASQMAAARQIDHSIEEESADGALKSLNGGTVCVFRAAARETVFPGYLKVYNIKDIGEEDDESELSRALPKVTVGMPCALLDLMTEQCFTAPPSRYSEASLVKALELNGVGRPSTFATIVNTIQEREYVSKDKGSLVPTTLGYHVNDFLVTQMPELFDIGFTSQMETELDQVEEGSRNWVEMLHEFYDKFQVWQKEHSTSSQESPIANNAAQELLQLIPEDFQFNPPVKRGTRTYDDRKFCTSLRDQLEKGKTLSDRQGAALQALLARYLDKLPEIQTKLQTLGMDQDIQNLKSEMEAAPAQEHDAPSDAEKSIFSSLGGITWQEPVKRGKRVYDDRKFVSSLQEQVENGRTLSDSQKSALGKLLAKYSAQIPGFAAFAETFGWSVTTAPAPQAATPAAELPPETKQEIAELVDKANAITEWRKPTGAGKRRFDDKTFAQSLIRQYKQKGTLSDKQVAALKKLLTHY